jgi:hypothetical protein
VPIRPKPHYNRSKRKAKAESIDKDKEDTPAKKKVNTKVDLGVAIAGLTEQMNLAIKSKEKFLTNQQKAI